MKILAIRGKNLASLETEFEIDFTVEPLKSAGIFAITGPTGAGKSTLLDALCLALFDDTPRTNRAKENIAVPDVKDKVINQKDSRTILRRGAGEGYAEVDFVALGGEKFRSRWMVKRARGRMDGAMQNSEIRLINLSAMQEEQGRKTELLTRITELIGLTFEQFTRSVLLAQGDFATFLKSRQSEKAELLEKLTGTEIYTQISIAVYERTKNAEQDYQLLHSRMEEVELLSEEGLNELQAEQQTLKQSQTLLKQEITVVEEKIKWIRTEQQWLVAIRQAEEELKHIQQKVQEAQPRYDYLNLLEKIQEIRDQYQAWRQVVLQISGNQEKVVQQKLAAEQNALELQKNGVLLETGEKEFGIFNEKVLQLEPQIVRARELDIRIGAAIQLVAGLQKELDNHREAEKVTKESVQKHLAEKKLAEDKVQVLLMWFEKHRDYESLIPRVELIVTLLDDLAGIKQQLKENNRIFADNKELLDKSNQQLITLQRESERLQRLLPIEILEWRSRLQDGQPCPVCGSVHHPWVQLPVEQGLEEEELEKAKKRVAEQLIRLTTEIESRQKESTRLSTLIENYQNHMLQIREKVQFFLEKFPDWEKCFQEGDLQRVLKDMANKWEWNTTEQSSLRERIGQLVAMLEIEQNKWAELADSLKEKEKNCMEHKLELENWQQERGQLLKGKKVDVVLTACDEKKKEFECKLKDFTEAQNKLISRQEAYNATRKQLEEETTVLQKKEIELKKLIDHWLASQEKQLTTKDLAELYAKDNVWIQAEKKFLNGLQEQLTVWKATLAERKHHLEQHAMADIRPKDEQETLENLQREWEERKQGNEQGLRRYTEIELALKNHQRGLEKIKSFEKELREKEQITNDWRKLNELFGSASGNKFKEIAQGYTLDVLLVYANKHLQELAGRYELQRIPETLALQVADLDMLGETRAVHSLSGGESFLISLALALGLASMSSNRMRVESLFIDEGFGSLDADTLRIAMDALEKLQTQGRKIGVISHVPEMTERIMTRIQVLKSSNGKSEIQMIGS